MHERIRKDAFARDARDAMYIRNDRVLRLTKFHASARLADKKDDRALGEVGEVEGEEQLQDTPKVPSIF